MSDQYTLNINGVDVVNLGNVANVVSHIHYEWVASDGIGNTASVGHVLPFQLTNKSYPDPANTSNTIVIQGCFDANNFTPFANLTFDIVKGWVMNNTTPEQQIEMQGWASQRLKALVNKPVNVSLPWVVNT